MTEVANRIERRLDALVESMLERLGESLEVQELMRPEWQPQTERIARDNLEGEITALRGLELPMSCPAEAAAAARAAVAFGAAPTVVAFCYRTGHAVLWEAWMEEVEGLGLDDELRRELLDAGSDFMFAYADRCTYFVELAHERERELLQRSQERERREAVLRLIDDGADPTAELDYALEQDHLALVAHGPEVGAVLDELSAELACELLVVSTETPDCRWVWLGRDHAFGPRDQGELRRLTPPPGARLSAGAPGRGLDGFRRSHIQAVAADRVGARRRPSGVVVYEDVALEGLALADPAGARAFVEGELDGLSDDDERTETLRDTLGAYFASAQNAASTASRIGVSERTIANRLRAIEQRLGCSIVARRAELETALRLRDVSSDERDDP